MSELERALVALGRDLDVPEAPDLESRVLHALERPARTSRLRVAVVLAAVLVAVVLAALADSGCALRARCASSTSARRASRSWTTCPRSCRSLRSSTSSSLSASACRSRRRAGARGYDLLELDEKPDRVYLGPRDSVWFLYGSPDAVRLLVAQTPRLRVDEDFIFKKLAAAEPGSSGQRCAAGRRSS